MVTLSILPIKKVRPHEKIIPSLLGSIEDNIEKTGYQRDPILIDSRTHIALDGMHRLEALKQLGARFVLCAEFDSFSKSVRVERWLRTFVAPTEGLVDALVDLFDMRRCSSARVGIQEVESGKSGIALLSRRFSYVGASGWDISRVYSKISEADKLCEKSKVEIHFLTESEKFDLFSSDAVNLLYPARLTKGQIAHFATCHRLLPYKTTRYVVPVRPMGIYYPLCALRHGSLVICNNLLQSNVKFSKVVLERRNIWYEGRKYSERLAIFRRAREMRGDSFNRKFAQDSKRRRNRRRVRQRP